MDENYSNFGYALLTLWEVAAGGSIDTNALITSGAWKVISLIILSIFLFISKIVLLNMIIALMRDMYLKVGGRMQASFQRLVNFTICHELFSTPPNLLPHFLLDWSRSKRMRTTSSCGEGRHSSLRYVRQQ